MHSGGQRFDPAILHHRSQDRDCTLKTEQRDTNVISKATEGAIVKIALIKQHCGKHFSRRKQKILSSQPARSPAQAGSRRRGRGNGAERMFAACGGRSEAQFSLTKGKYNFVKQLLLNLHNSREPENGRPFSPIQSPAQAGLNRRGRGNGTERMFFACEGRSGVKFSLTKVKLIRAQGECLGIRSR